MERLLGVETEYALVGLKPDGGSLDGERLAKELLRIAKEDLVHLRDAGANGMYLGNGGRFYVDAGFHPEMATPECSSPWEVVRYVEAGERILADLAVSMTDRSAGVSHALAFKCNVDYSGESRSTWGCHESYLHRVDPTRMPRDVIPHLVSRIVYSGSGGFNSLTGGTEFLISPRAPHMVSASSSNSTSHRGIFHTKDESLSAAGYHRLHVISGESLCSGLASWLKVGTTALVVAMSEAGLRPGVGVQLDNPVKALQSIAADPTCQKPVALRRGRRTAVEIQRHYLELAVTHLGDPHMPVWAEAVCEEWNRTLDLLERAPESVSTRLDWAIKWALYSDCLEREGWSWTQIPPEAGYRLYETDMRYGQLGEQSVFRMLESDGVLDCDVEGIGDVYAAMSTPPSTGRARVRGEWVQRLNGEEALCDWQAIVHQSRRLDLSDPFKTEVDWKEAPLREPLRSLFEAMGL